jgi:hypothetical protein
MRGDRPRSVAVLSRPERSGLTLHDERAVSGVDRLRAGRRAVTVECRAAGELDRVGDDLRALRAR